MKYLKLFLVPIILNLSCNVIAQTQTKKIVRKDFRFSNIDLRFGTPEWHYYSFGFSGNINKHQFSANLLKTNYGLSFTDTYFELFRNISPNNIPAGVPTSGQKVDFSYSTTFIKLIGISTSYEYNSHKTNYLQQKDRSYYSDSITNIFINSNFGLNSSSHKLNIEMTYYSTKARQQSHALNKKGGYSIRYKIDADWNKKAAVLESTGIILNKIDSSSANISNRIKGNAREKEIRQSITYEWNTTIGNLLINGDYITSKLISNDSISNKGIHTNNSSINYTNSQFINAKNISDYYKGRISYQPKKYLNVSYTINYHTVTSNRLNNSNDLAESTSPQFNNEMLFQKKSNKFSCSFGHKIKEVSFTSNLFYEVVSVNTTESFPEEIKVYRTYYNPGLNIRIILPFFTPKAGKLEIGYNNEYRQPDFFQLQPYTDNTNLNQWYIGNRYLVQNNIKTFSFRYDIPQIYKRIKTEINGAYINTTNEIATVIQSVSTDSLYDGLWQIYKGMPIFSFININKQQLGHITLKAKSNITKKIHVSTEIGSRWYNLEGIQTYNYFGNIGTTLDFKIHEAIRSGKLNLSLYTDHNYRPTKFVENFYFMNMLQYGGSVNLSFSVFKLFEVNLTHRETLQNIRFSQNIYSSFNLLTTNSSMTLRKKISKYYYLSLSGLQDYTRNITSNRIFDNHFINVSFKYNPNIGINFELVVQNLFNRNTMVGQVFNPYYTESYSNLNMGRIIWLNLSINPNQLLPKVRLELKKRNIILDFKKP